MLVSGRRMEFSGSNGKNALMLRLESDAKHLKILRVSDVKQLFLSAAGLLAGKYALTNVGATQYLGYIGKGLSQLVRFMLSAEQGHSTDPARLYPVLARMINQLLAHREEALQGCRAICADDREQLDGFVGRSYCLVPNLEVAEYFAMACEMLRGNPQFYHAALHGRDMTLVNISRKNPLLVGQIGVRTGAVVQNSETAGRAIRSACVVLDSVSRTWSADSFYTDTRVMHVRGAKLRDKMMQSADSLNTRQMSADDISQALTAAVRKPILRAKTDAAVAEFSRGLHAKAERFGVTAGAVDQVLASLQFDGPRVMTSFDLYTRCLAVAKDANVQRSLPLRQLAFSVVFTRQ